MLTSKLYNERVNFFNYAIKNFKNEKLSELVVAHKINKKIFKKVKKSALKYYNNSKKFSLINMTPNGRLAPKVEIQKSFNEFIIEYFKLIESIKIDMLEYSCRGKKTEEIHSMADEKIAEMKG